MASFGSDSGGHWSTSKIVEIVKIKPLELDFCAQGSLPKLATPGQLPEEQAGGQPGGRVGLQSGPEGD